MTTTNAVKVGDTVRVTRNTKVAKAGDTGVVIEIRDAGDKYTDGVSVEFMQKPDPYIARIFGKDPNVAEPMRCLFPKAAKMPFAKV